MSERFPNNERGFYNESTWSAPYPRQPNPIRFHTEDMQTAEAEVHDLVAGMIRGSQPTVCLETGTSRGLMAVTIGRALVDNAFGAVIPGYLVTYEPDTEVYDEAVENLSLGYNQERTGNAGDAPLPNHDLPVTVLNEPSMGLWNNPKIDFAWFDSDIALRAAEFDYYKVHAAPGAVFCFHDTAPRFGAWSADLRARLNAAKWRCIDWPSPRGIVIATPL